MYYKLSPGDYQRELIDTCWDVNYTSLQLYCPFSGELIDTCWDVNCV